MKRYDALWWQPSANCRLSFASLYALSILIFLHIIECFIYQVAPAHLLFILYECSLFRYDIINYFITASITHAALALGYIIFWLMHIYYLYIYIVRLAQCTLSWFQACTTDVMAPYITARRSHEANALMGRFRYHHFALMPLPFTVSQTSFTQSLLTGDDYSDFAFIAHIFILLLFYHCIYIYSLWLRQEKWQQFRLTHDGRIDNNTYVERSFDIVHNVYLTMIFIWHLKCQLYLHAYISWGWLMH